MQLRLTKNKQGEVWLHIVAGHSIKQSGRFASILIEKKSPIIQAAIDLAVEEQAIQDAQLQYLATVAK